MDIINEFAEVIRLINTHVHMKADVLLLRHWKLHCKVQNVIWKLKKQLKKSIIFFSVIVPAALNVRKQK